MLFSYVSFSSSAAASCMKHFWFQFQIFNFSPIQFAKQVVLFNLSTMFPALLNLSRPVFSLWIFAFILYKGLLAPEMTLE